MVTRSDQIQWFANNTVASYIAVFYGLSTDEKPVEYVVNGSLFIELNTSKIYFFDQAHLTWIEWCAS